MPVSDSFRERYFKMAKESGETSGGIMDALCALAREEARRLLREDRNISKRALADEFKGIAEECYATSVEENWLNDYALSIGDSIRQAVMSLHT